MQLQAQRSNIESEKVWLIKSIATRNWYRSIERKQTNKTHNVLCGFGFVDAIWIACGSIKVNATARDNNYEKKNKKLNLGEPLPSFIIGGLAIGLAADFAIAC